MVLNIDDTRLKKASLNNLGYTADRLHSIYRLERGLSTNNLAANINARDMDPAEQDALRRAVAAMFELPKIKETQAAGPDQEQKSAPADG